MSDLARRFLAGLGADGQDRDGEDAPQAPEVDAIAKAGLGLAVSGGGDSMAMLHLAAELGLGADVVTVDHGLRPEAAAEAAEVGRVCAKLGLRHDILHWHWDGAGNLQDAARKARRGLIADWARAHGLRAVALAHTQDDLAETLLMRLARGAGVDGLAAMSPRFDEGGIVWLRPLLTAPREELRVYLRGRGLGWAEDPSNDNPRFDRVKARRALQALQPLGLTPARLAEVAGHLAEAREALDLVTDAAAQALQLQDGVIWIGPTDLAALAPEIRRRLVQRIILHIAPADYGPRGPALQALIARLLAGRAAVLAGCRFLPIKGRIAAFREARAVQDRVSATEIWDGRWRMAGPVPPGAELGALGDGIASCPDWRAQGLPRAALLTSPALWQDGRLIAAPHAGLGPERSVIPLQSAAALHHSRIAD